MSFPGTTAFTAMNDPLGSPEGANVYRRDENRGAFRQNPIDVDSVVAGWALPEKTIRRTPQSQVRFTVSAIEGCAGALSW
jgi:hypothetical protein